jgi:hypothetical protein
MELLETLINFAEENWIDFVIHCEEQGLREKDIEKYISELRKHHLT